MRWSGTSLFYTGRKRYARFETSLILTPEDYSKCAKADDVSPIISGFFKKYQLDIDVSLLYHRNA